jgi:hypothetical protein
MAKNDHDNRETLATAIVNEYFFEELVNIAISARMEHYAEHEDSFQEDWHRHMEESTDAETKEVKVLVVGDDSMRNLARMVAEINDENPGSLRLVEEAPNATEMMKDPDFFSMLEDNLNAEDEDEG